ncbi:Putative transporter svop-1 [Eumeta japonica]|uniref:Transporter svop-1 n=1 Tax=Eumeta variegata TaxID=151549 RepID=A0A4C1U5K5_EUMVA|nr:Putative transporter svop-1 [Eumeta japonica]
MQSWSIEVHLELLVGQLRPYSSKGHTYNLGHGKFNRLVLLTSGLIMLNVSMESVGMSYVVPVAACDLHLTNEHKGLITASAFIGIMCTSFLWGYLGDRCGRRAVMLPALLASAALSVASAFSVNVWMLIILRVLTGCLALMFSEGEISFIWGGGSVQGLPSLSRRIVYALLRAGATRRGLSGWRGFYF